VPSSDHWVDGYFDVVLISEETRHAKLDPYNSEELKRRVEASEYWYVGDNPRKDSAAPNAMGWRTVGVRTSRGLHAAADADVPPEHRPSRWVDGDALSSVWDTGARA
jgi:FMN phosphatase YigB (HAD superfamily)